MEFDGVTARVVVVAVGVAAVAVAVTRPHEKKTTGIAIEME